MCGIAGFLDLRLRNSSERLRAIAQRMGDPLQHRGPDDSGVWADAAAGIAFAHRRLAILDLSSAGRQPMLSGSGRYIIVFNGEIYNYQELRIEVEKATAARISFRGHSDTEVLLACIERWGLQATLRRANGMFAFALWDRQERTLYLGRDRLGEKPLYYGWAGPVFLFGSELKALRAHPGFVAEIDRHALTLYLRHNCVPAPHAIYQGVQKLLPGTILVVTDANSKESPPQAFWSLQEVAGDGVNRPFHGTDDQAQQQLDELLRDAVRMRMLSDVPLGAFLSGGMDSSLITSIMQEQSARAIKTFSIGFTEAQYDEAGHAAKIARHLGTDHTELYVTPQDALAVIPALPAIYDEPFADSSQIPMCLLARMARHHVTVGLSGDGGDEIFCGYTRHVWSARVWKIIDFTPPPLRRALAAILSSVSPNRWDSLFQVLNRFLPASWTHRLAGQKLHKLARLFALRTQESVYQELISHWGGLESIVIGADPLLPYNPLPGVPPKLLGFTEQMMLQDTLAGLPDDMLTKVDRATMAVGLEARVPLLDHRVVAFAWKLPMSMKLRGRQGKWILRQLLQRRVPPALMDRPKSGFSIPLDAWLRGQLRDWAEALLSERRLRHDGFFHASPIRQKWAEHLSGKRSWQHDLWGVLMFQAWLDEVRQPAQQPSVLACAAG